MLITFKRLILELTRQCNMRCAHCMRGEPEDKTIGTSILERLFREVRHIEHLGLTGGEPALVPEQIEWIVHLAKRWGCTIGHFFCATNGKAYSPKFAEALEKLYRYCIQKDQCTLSISFDQFHEPADPKAVEQYRRLPFYKPVNEQRTLAPNEILSDGRAKENGLGLMALPDQKWLYEYSLKGFHMECGDIVYINTNGDVLLNPDVSYRNQKKKRIGNLLDEALPHILTTHIYTVKLEPQKYVFCLHLYAEPGTVADEAIEDRRYYRQEQQAMASYTSGLHNIHITPVSPATADIPAERLLTAAELPDFQQGNNRLIGTKVTYSLPDGKTAGAVTLEVLSHPLEDADE